MLVSLYRLIIPFNLGLEIIGFYSIIISIAISPVLGVLLAILALVVGHIMYRNFCVFLFIKCGVYSLLCYSVLILAPLDIVKIGIITTVLRNLLLMGATVMINPKRVVSNIPAVLINIILNIWLFVKLGEFLVSIL